jgi:RND family efflux transporter MFP subunit
MLALPGCGGEEPDAAPVLRPVRAQQIYSTGGSRARSFSGSSRAGVETRLSFKVGGTLQRLAVKVGDEVAAGALIAEIDPKDYRLRLEEADASLKRQQAQLRSYTASYERIRGLYENGHTSLNELDQARASFETAQAAVRSSEKALELARSQLESTTLTAPVPGSIADVDVEANENVQPGQVVAVLTSGSQPEVEVSVPENLITQIREGASVQVTFDAIPDRRFAATVTEVAVAAMGVATTFPVTVRLQESDDAIRPGMAAEVSFSFESSGDRERILVPPSAVGEDREGRFVFVVTGVADGVGTAARRTVEVGELTGEGLEVVSGLENGDLLVTAGVTKLADGRQVKLLARSGADR